MRVLATVKEFMFPESHAHSFASIAYSSAYTRHHYPAAYTCALFNNQPMGFYSPATIANDAKRHGVKIVPIDVQRSDWFCTLEELSEHDRLRYAGRYAVRMGMKYVKGLRQRIADAITDARLMDGPVRLGVRSSPPCPINQKGGANAFGESWNVQLDWREASPTHRSYGTRSVLDSPLGPLFEHVRDEHELASCRSICDPMTTEERLVADFDSTGVTLGPHPMAYHRAEMNAAGVLPAAGLHGMQDGTYTRIAGAVIARQRPGTAEGFHLPQPRR